MYQNQSQNQADDTMTAVASAAERRPWLSFTAITGIIFGIVGLYQPAIDLYKWYADKSLREAPSVQYAEYQRTLWVKNATCYGGMTMSEALLDNNVSVRVGACPSKDIFVQILPKGAPAVSTWISPSHVTQAGLPGGFFSAYAAAMTAPSPAHEKQSAIPVQLRITTQCQSWADQNRRSKLIRIVNENGKCFKEVTNVYSGKVEYREEVACNTSCSSPASQ